MAGRQGRAGWVLPALLRVSWPAAAHDTLHYAEAEIRRRIDLPAASKTTEASPVLALDQSSAEDVCGPTQPPPEALWARALLLLRPNLSPALLKARHPLPSNQELGSRGASVPVPTSLSPGLCLPGQWMLKTSHCPERLNEAERGQITCPQPCASYP